MFIESRVLEQITEGSLENKLSLIQEALSQIDLLPVATFTTHVIAADDSGDFKRIEYFIKGEEVIFGKQESAKVPVYKTIKESRERLSSRATDAVDAFFRGDFDLSRQFVHDLNENSDVLSADMLGDNLLVSIEQASNPNRTWLKWYKEESETIYKLIWGDSYPNFNKYPKQLYSEEGSPSRDTVISSLECLNDELFKMWERTQSVLRDKQSLPMFREQRLDSVVSDFAADLGAMASNVQEVVSRFDRIDTDVATSIHDLTVARMPVLETGMRLITRICTEAQ